MGLHLKTAAGLLLLVQALHLASLQHSTDSPRQPIDISWLRELTKNKTVSQNTELPGGEPEYDQRAGAAAESSSDYNIASGSVAIFTEEEENVSGQDKNTNEGSGDESSITITEPPTVQNVTSSTAELPEVEVSPTTAGAPKSSQVNVTDTTEATHNTTAAPQSSSGDLSAQNSTSVDHTNLTNSMTTPAPEDKVTEESTTKAAPKTPLANVTQTTDTTTPVPDIPETNATSFVSTVDQPPTTSAEGSTSASTSASTSTSPSTSASTSASTSGSPSTSASTSASSSASASPSTSAFASPDLNTPEMANKTGKGSSAEGSSSDRGLESDSGTSHKWGVVLGSMVAVACVVAVTCVLLKRRYQKDFSHRKLVEEYPSEPVLRLDNCEPLDLTLGRLSYYNSGLQGDNIQMSSLHERN